MISNTQTDRIMVVILVSSTYWVKQYVYPQQYHPRIHVVNCLLHNIPGWFLHVPKHVTFPMLSRTILQTAHAASSKLRITTTVRQLHLRQEMRVSNQGPAAKAGSDRSLLLPGGCNCPPVESSGFRSQVPYQQWLLGPYTIMFWNLQKSVDLL